MKSCEPPGDGSPKAEDLTPKVRKAVLPSAGFGTRMQPFSWILPKELVPLGNVPALHFVLDEVVRAGLTEVAIVSRKGKGLLADHVARAQDEGLFAGLRIQWVAQSQPLGLGDAIAESRDFVDGDPFALLWPDNILLSPQHDLAPMIRLHEATGLDVFGVLELDESHTERYGHSGLFRHREEEAWEGHRRVRIVELRDKGPGRLTIGPGETVLRTTGRIIAHPDLLAEIEVTREQLTQGTRNGELDEVPAYQRIIARRGAWGLVMHPPLFDTGHPAGVLAASAYLQELESSRRSTGETE